MKIQHVFTLIVLFTLPGGAHARVDSSSRDTQRSDFIAAEKALQKGNLQNAEVLMSRLKHYPLYPYLEYEKPLNKMQSHQTKKQELLPLSTLQAFQQRYPDFGPSHRLLYHWLLNAAARQDWKAFEEGFALNQNRFEANSLRCYHHLAQYQLDQKVQHLKDALPLWQVGKPQLQACDELFSLMQKKQIIQDGEILERLELSLKEKEYRLARHLSTLLSKSLRPEATLLIQVAENPHTLLKEKTLEKINAADLRDTIFRSAFYRLVRTKPNLAKQLYSENLTRKKMRFSKETRDIILKDISIRLALNKDKDAYEWFKKIPDITRFVDAHEWMIRVALYHHDWEEALNLIDDLDETTHDKMIWQYWKARALLETGKREEAHQLFNELCKSRSYYGFLASERIQQPLFLDDRPETISSELVKKMERSPLFSRLEELMALNRISLAKSEWYYYLKTLDDKEKVHAAFLADEKNWHFLAILGLSKSASKDDLKIRFPLAFAKPIHKHANRCDLDPAWVFALTRQESAFSHQVRSPVGATGLMQLMPKTAQHVAKINHLPLPHVKDLFEPETNITLGTMYLKSLSDRLKGQVILATASYNAGLNRIQRWLPEKTMDSDIWIENIPYLETRDYVQNVLTYMGIYKSRLGQSFSLSEIMKPVSAANLPD